MLPDRAKNQSDCRIRYHALLEKIRSDMVSETTSADSEGSVLQVLEGVVY